MTNDYLLILPEIILLVTGLLVLFLDAFSDEIGVSKGNLGGLTIFGAALSIFATILLVEEQSVFFNIYSIDNLTHFFRILLSAILLILVIGTKKYNESYISHIGEYYFLLISATLGGIVMIAGIELITIYVGLELLSFSLYVAVSSLVNDKKSGEASLKYVLIGGVGSAILLYGLSMIYGSAHSTFYATMGINFASEASYNSELLLIGLIFFFAGIGFKLSAVPFHMWAPDVYEGAPLPITAFLSTASKAIVIGFLFRLLGGPFSSIMEHWNILIIILSVLTMIVGNLIAIQQSNIKRMLAYSSVGQIGYILMALPNISSVTASAALFHLSGYVITNLLIFIVVTIYYSNNKETSMISDFKGLSDTQPFLAFALTAGLFSLAGMPLLAGFFTKFILFQAVVSNGYLWLVIIAITMSTISLFYYLQIVKQMYLYSSDELGAKFHISFNEYFASGFLFIAMVFLGIYGTPLYEYAERATKILF